jgi:hypothetical protein
MLFDPLRLDRRGDRGRLRAASDLLGLFALELLADLLLLSLSLDALLLALLLRFLSFLESFRSGGRDRRGLPSSSPGASSSLPCPHSLADLCADRERGQERRGKGGEGGQTSW